MHNKPNKSLPDILQEHPERVINSGNQNIIGEMNGDIHQTINHGSDIEIIKEILGEHFERILHEIRSNAERGKGRK